MKILKFFFVFRAAGQTLLTYMSKRHSLTEDDVAQIIRQLLEILEYLHGNNVIHNDIRVRRLSLSFSTNCMSFSTNCIVRSFEDGRVQVSIGAFLDLFQIML